VKYIRHEAAFEPHHSILKNISHPSPHVEPHHNSVCFRQTTFATVLDRSPAANAVIEKRATVSGTAVVHLDDNTGNPQYLASGLIYGIPDTANQIPDHFYTDTGFSFGRASGAQVLAKGWLGGVDQYVVSKKIHSNPRFHP